LCFSTAINIRQITIAKAGETRSLSLLERGLIQCILKLPSRRGKCCLSNAFIVFKLFILIKM
jgi:hypothetical protein